MFLFENNLLYICLWHVEVRVTRLLPLIPAQLIYMENYEPVLVVRSVNSGSTKATNAVTVNHSTTDDGKFFVHRWF
jgi:hypothetical protein